MPAAVRFEVLMRRMRERTRGVPARAIARAAGQAVHEVRREARRRVASCLKPSSTRVPALLQDALRCERRCPPDAARIGIVGASNGTTTALDYAVLAEAEARPVPAALVFLTGGVYTENNNGVDANRTLLEPIPILFEYADDEAVWSAQFLAGAPSAWVFDERNVSPLNGHGTNMFDADSESIEFVVGFLADAL